MAVFEWLFGRKKRLLPQAQSLCGSPATMPKRPPTVYLAASNGDFRDIVGEADHQDALARINGGRMETSAEIDMNIILRLEPDNSHDTEAVAVVIEAQKVGYLTRKDAVVTSGFLRLHGTSEAHCLGEIVQYWTEKDGDDRHFVVKLDTRWPPVRD